MYSWLPHTVTLPPEGEPLSLEELKPHCNVLAGDTDFDVELEIYRKAAISAVEARTGTKLITQTVSMQADCFAALNRFPIAPLQSVSSIEYLDTTGALQTLDPTVYEAVLPGLRPFVRLKPNQVFPCTWKAKDAVRVIAVAGYGDDATKVPDDVRNAILLIAADWFAKREDTNAETRGVFPMPNNARSLISNHSMSI